MNVSDDSEDGYVLVKQEDIVDGIACFMAAYLLSLKQTKVYMLSLHFTSLYSVVLEVGLCGYEAINSYNLSVQNRVILILGFV
jgi:hypothetical protein